MTDPSKATPRPWNIQPMYGPSGDVLFYAIVADGGDQWDAVASTFNRDGKSLETHQADAALILQAVNERDELIATLDEIEDVIDQQTVYSSDHPDDQEYEIMVTAKLLRRIGAALSRANQ